MADLSILRVSPDKARSKVQSSASNDLLARPYISELSSPAALPSQAIA